MTLLESSGREAFALPGLWGLVGSQPPGGTHPSSILPAALSCAAWVAQAALDVVAIVSDGQNYTYRFVGIILKRKIRASCHLIYFRLLFSLRACSQVMVVKKQTGAQVLFDVPVS